MSQLYVTGCFVFDLSGIDSRYNVGCSELANYLFCGRYKHNRFDIEQIPEDFPEEVLDGMTLQFHGYLSYVLQQKHILTCFFYTLFMFAYF